MKLRTRGGKLLMAASGVKRTSDGPPPADLSFTHDVSSFGFGVVDGLQRLIGMTINVTAADPLIDEFYISFDMTTRGEKVRGGVSSHTIDMRRVFPDDVPETIAYLIQPIRDGVLHRGTAGSIEVPPMLPDAIDPGVLTLTFNPAVLTITMEVDPLPVPPFGDLIGFAFKHASDPVYLINLVDPDEGGESVETPGGSGTSETPDPLPPFSVDVPFDNTLWTFTFGVPTWNASINVASIASIGQGPWMDTPVSVPIDVTGVLAIDGGSWTLASINDANPEGRVRVNVTGTLAPPTGWSVWARVTTSPDPFTGATPSNSQKIVPGTPWETTQVFTVGATVYAGIMVQDPQGALHPAVAAAKSVVILASGVVTPPVLLSGPTVSGLIGSTAVIGSNLTGVANYSNAASIEYAWVRDAATVIDSDDAYSPVGGHDGYSMRLRARATSPGGAVVENFSAVFTVKYAQPIAGTLPNIGYVTGSGDKTVNAAPAFTGGAAGTYSVAATGLAGVTIDAATGAVKIPTPASQYGTVTVTKANSGGSAQVAFDVAVNPDGRIDIPTLPDSLYTFREVVPADGQPEFKIRLDLGAFNFLPAGWEIRRSFKVGAPATPADGAGFTPGLVTPNTTSYSTNAFAKDNVVYCCLWFKNNNATPVEYFACGAQRQITMQGFAITPPPSEVTIVAFSTADRNALIAKPLVRHDHAITGGGGSSAGYSEVSTALLAQNSAGGATSDHMATDARLKAQLEYWCLDANAPDGDGAYRAQHQVGGAMGCIVAAKTGVARVWDSISAANRGRLETIMQAIAFGSMISQAANHPFGAQQSRPSLRGQANGGTLNGSAPNFYCAHAGAILLLHAFYGNVAAGQAKCTAFDIATFRNQCTGQGLPKLAYTWSHPSGYTDAQMNACVRNFVWYQQNWTVASIDALIGRIRGAFVASVDGVNGGVGCRDAELPNAIGQSGRNCKEAVGRGKKYAAAASSTATKMIAEFNTSNGVWSGLDLPAGTTAADFADLNKRSDFNYANSCLGAVQAMMIGCGISGLYSGNAAFNGMVADVNQGMIDYNAKAQGWHSVSNISLKAQYKDFDSSKHAEYIIPQKASGWSRLYNFLT